MSTQRHVAGTTGYDGAAAHIYDQVYSTRAREWAPRIRAFHEEHSAMGGPAVLVDLCCGNGHLLRHFVEHGYDSYGVDRSADMLAQARKNLRECPPDRYHLIQADVSQVRFPPGTTAGLVVSTVDALNHLPGPEALRSCFDIVAAVLAPGGHFVFDLLTPVGFADSNHVGATVLEDSAVISRGVYLPEEARAYSRTTGFLRRKDGLYERFDLNAARYAFDFDMVERELLAAGFRTAHRARLDALHKPAPDSDGADRLFFVARR